MTSEQSNIEYDERQFRIELSALYRRIDMIILNHTDILVPSFGEQLTASVCYEIEQFVSSRKI